MNLVDSIERLGDGGLDILNLVIPKPDIPADIAQNYKQVQYRVQKFHVACTIVI